MKKIALVPGLIELTVWGSGVTQLGKAEKTTKKYRKGNKFTCMTYRNQGGCYFSLTSENKSIPLTFELGSTRQKGGKQVKRWGR